MIRPVNKLPGYLAEGGAKLGAEGCEGADRPIKIKDAMRLYSRAVKPGAFVRKREKRLFTTALTWKTVGDIGNSFALAEAACGHQSKKIPLMLCGCAHPNSERKDQNLSKL